MRRPTGREELGGVCYATTDTRLELPVVDVSHPAFAVVRFRLEP